MIDFDGLTPAGEHRAPVLARRAGKRPGGTPGIVVTLVAALVLLLSIWPAGLLPAGQAACERWVAPPPAGSDTAPGTAAQPWATLDHAVETVPDSGCVVWFKDGVYTGNNRLNRRLNAMATFRAVNPYRAILQNSGPVVNISGGKYITLEGFRFRHSGPGASPLLVIVDMSDEGWAEWIVFRNNIFHDATNNDLLKLLDGVKNTTVEGNLFYNQGPNEDHMDVNSVTDVTIQDNIFFNDFAGSGRVDPRDTKAFITVKDSNGDVDGLLGSERVVIRRNIFLNWQGDSEPFLQIGNGGKPYYEAKEIRIENNLMIGNSADDVNVLLAIAGVRDLTFVNNKVVGDLPARAYALRIDRKGDNPQNQNITLANNIWSDPTGTMGAGPSSAVNEFSDGDPAEVDNLVLDNNLYWNGGAPIPPGDLISPLAADARRVVANPLLNTNHSGLILPRWNGSAFLSGSATIREEFERLVESYGKIPAASPAFGKADPALAPATDILGRPRSARPEIGAYEYQFILSGTGELTSIILGWTDPAEPAAAGLDISYRVGSNTQTITNISPSARAYTLTGLQPYTFYAIWLTLRDAQSGMLARSNEIIVLTSDHKNFLPLIMENYP